MATRVSLLPAIPANGEHLLTGISCPDCAGTLIIRAHGALLTFTCWIGHVYSLPELLAAKEERLEQRLWTALSSLEEIAIILADVESRGLSLPDPEGFRRRGAVALDQAGKLRSVIEGDRPLIPPGAEDHFVQEPP